MPSGVLAVEQQTPVYLLGIVGLIEHLVLPHLENAAACATNFAARAPPVTQDPPVRRAGYRRSDRRICTSWSPGGSPSIQPWSQCCAWRRH